MKECVILRGRSKHTMTLLHIFRGVRTPNPRIYTALIYRGSWIAGCVLRATAHADIIT